MNTIAQYLNAFRIYSPTALLLALGVTLFCSLLKKTVLKKCPKKLFVFLPFLVGFLAFAGMKMLLLRNLTPLTETLPQTMEGGFACGCAATLYYVAYEQFFRKKAKTEENPVYPLLEGIVAEEKRTEIANLLFEEGKKKREQDLLLFTEETLRTYASENLTEAELFGASRIINACLTHFHKT